MRRAATLALLLAFAAPGAARAGDDKARAVARCGPGATAELRLERRDDALAVRFRLGGRRPESWRVTLVHERRVVWQGTLSAHRGATRELRRALRDLPGSDTVAVHARGGRGGACRLAATLP